MKTNRIKYIFDKYSIFILLCAFGLFALYGAIINFFEEEIIATIVWFVVGIVICLLAPKVIKKEEVKK